MITIGADVQAAVQVSSPCINLSFSEDDQQPSKGYRRPQQSSTHVLSIWKVAVRSMSRKDTASLGLYIGPTKAFSI